MALPPGLTAKTVTIGIASFFDGTLAEGTATITAPVNVIHTPTNRPLFSSQISKRFVDGEASFNLAPTDAAGLNNVSWTYKLSVVISGALVQPDPIYFLLPEAGPNIVDLDSLVTVPSSAGIPVSVDALTSAQLPAQMATIAAGDNAFTVAQRAAFDAWGGGSGVAGLAIVGELPATPVTGTVYIVTGATSAPTPPSALTLTATPGNGQVTISAAGGAGTGVTYALYRGTTVTGSPIATSFPFTDTGRTNGTPVSYIATATNAAGTVTSAVVTATPTSGATVPGQVTGLTATPGNGQVVLAWSAPASNGGSAITDYKVEYRTGAAAFAVFTDGTSTTTGATVTGLTNGTAYDFRVSAVNAIGAGTASATASATPAGSTAGVAIATDNFTGTTGDDNLAGRTTTTGGKTWTKPYGYNAGINANRAALVGANGSSRTLATIDAGVADVDVTATYQSTVTDETGLVVRCTADGANYVALVAQGGYRIFHRADATATISTETALSGVVGPVPAVGDVMRLKVSGTTYTAYVNGTQVAQVTSALADGTATRAGLVGRGASFQIFFDDFAVVTA